VHEVPRSVRGRNFAQVFAHWRQSTLAPPRTAKKASHVGPAERLTSSFFSEDGLEISDPSPELVPQKAQAIEIRLENESHNSPIPSDNKSLWQPPPPPARDVTPPSDVDQHPSSEPAPTRDTVDATIGLPSPPPRPILGKDEPTKPSRIQPLSALVSTESKVIAPDEFPAESPSPRKSNFTIAEPLQTELGGILFLVNVLKALDLPRSLETECRRDLGLSSWELLELLGRCLLAPSESHLACDPVWDALALLDGRAMAAPPGTHFAPSTFYRLPKAWIHSASAGISVENIQIRHRGTLLELWHPDGFPILSRGLAKQPSRETIRKEIEHFTADSVECSPNPHSSRPLVGCQPIGIPVGKPLRRFLAFLLPYVRMRLAQSLGLPFNRRPFFAKSLLLQRARILLTKTHVDLMMDLNSASGRIRLSGLDATPGWVPSFGRVITFHFGKGN
jgi:hypothetical protein